jgi:hypothetical protein
MLDDNYNASQRMAGLLRSQRRPPIDWWGAMSLFIVGVSVLGSLYLLYSIARMIIIGGDCG